MNQITQDILSCYGFEYDKNNYTAVPIEEIIEFHFDLEILWDNVNYYDPEGLIMAAIVPSKRRIIMNESYRHLFEEKIGTMHFTMAHELGHWVLHADTNENQLELSVEKDTFYCRSARQKSSFEYQADMFAGSILMPQSIISEAVNKIKDNGTVRMHDLYILAKAFGVSISALKTRMEQVNLLYIDDTGNIYNSIQEYQGQMTFEF